MATDLTLPGLVKQCFSALKSLTSDWISQTKTNVIACSTWEDEAGRFRVWAGNLGAHQTGTSSLSYRLRHAPSIQEDIVETLSVLLKAAEEVRSIIEDTKSEDVVDEEYIEELYKDVADSIAGLFRLGTVIRNPSRRDQLLVRSYYDISTEPYDINHVRFTLPRAPDFLSDRLGRANTQRRSNFRYLQRHHEKMARGLDEEDGKSRMSGTIATEVSVELVQGDQDDNMSNVGSVTSYAPSLFTAAARRFPAKPQPTTSDGRFECPLCFYLIKATTTMAWRKHVFVDLQPYVCIFPSCSHANKLYSSRREWYSHELQHHSNEDQSGTKCSMCDQPLSQAISEKHLGRHLEDLALFTLPTQLFDNNDDSADELAENSQDERSIISKEDNAVIDQSLSIPNEPDVTFANNIDDDNVRTQTDKEIQTETENDQATAVVGYHHDIKPDNIFVSEERSGQVPILKLSDFGAGKFSAIRQEHESGPQTHSALAYIGREAKVGTNRVILDEEERNRREEEEREERRRIILEERERSRRAEEEAEEERRRILLEEEERRRKEKEEREEIRKKVLVEEEEKIKRRDTKMEEEEEEEEQEEEEKEDFRPRYIRVHTRHLYPETLDEYRLPWVYDPSDERYIIIQENISHELQQELFKHTRSIKNKRKPHLLTDK